MSTAKSRFSFSRYGAATIVTIGAAFTVTTLAIAMMHALKDRMEDRAVIQKVQQLVDRENDRYQDLRRDNAPPYLVRYQKAKLDAANRFLKRTKADVRSALKKANQKVSLDNLETTVSLTLPPFVQLVKSLADTGKKHLQMRRDQLAGTNSFQQAAVDDLKRIGSHVDQVKEILKRANSRQANVMSGEDLTIVMASVELAHIKKRLQAARPGLSTDDPAYVNALRNYFNKFYVSDDEVIPRGDFKQLTSWINNLIDIEFGPRTLEGSVWIGTTTHESTGKARMAAIWEPTGIQRYKWHRGYRMTVLGTKPNRVKLKFEAGPYSVKPLDPKQVPDLVTEWTWAGGGSGWIESNQDHTEFWHRHTRKEDDKSRGDGLVDVGVESRYKIDGNKLTIRKVYVETREDGEQIRRDITESTLYRQ